MTTPWLSVVGIGEEGLPGLSPAARALVDAAEVLVGGERHLAMLGEVAGDRRERIAWPSPLSALIERIDGLRGRRVCVLATGDPFCHGIGTTLARRIPLAEMAVLPTPSALSLACARLGWPQHTVRLVTLHGRPLDLLNRELRDRARLVLLSENAETPALVAERLAALGWGESRVAVLEHMGGERERRLDGTAAGWQHLAGADFNTIAVELVAGPDAVDLPTVPGLPDEAFRHDGQLTKREVRAATLAALGPGPGRHLWDIGAGSGSISIEWLRAEPTATATGIEPKADRRALAAENAAALGVPHLKLIDGTAPTALKGLDGSAAPDAVFIGGGIGTEGLMAFCWNALRPGGRLVANVVTLEGEQAVMHHADALGGDLTRIAVSRAEPVGPYRGWRPLMAVTQWSVTKPRSAR